MRKFLPVIVCLSLATRVVAQGVKDKLDHVMESLTKEGHFNGTVLVAKKGTVLLEKGYGMRNIEKKLPSEPNTIYRIGQITEALTSEIIVQLDSKGQLGLDDRVSKYLPDFSGGDKVSIRNLMSHTSGVATYIPDTTIQKNRVCRPMNLETFIETYRGKQLLFEPGSRLQYSNADYILLGFIIGKISKVYFDDEMNYKITGVCAMRRSGFDFSDLKDENKATGYYYEADQFSPVRTTGDTAILYPANAMYSTVGDLFKWHEALRWYKLLPKDWQELSYVPVKNQFALGWTIEKMYNKRFMEQEGSFGGFTTSVIRQEEDDVFIVVLENKMQAGYHNTTIAKALLKILYGPDNTPKPSHTEKQEKKEAPAEGTDRSLKRYTGKFTFNTDYTLTIRIKNDSLTVESPDQQPITLEPESGSVFKTKGADVSIEFVADQKGAVNKAMLRQNGQEYAGKRVK